MIPSDRTSRLLPALDAKGIPRECLKRSIWVVGTGTLGSRISELLIRLGIDTLWLVDPDRVEEKDLVQAAFLGGHVGMLKVEAMRAFSEKISSPTEVRPLTLFCEQLGPGVIQEGDLIFSSLDRPGSRIDLYRQVFPAGIPFIDVAVDGHDGRITEIAGKGACYHCHLDVPVGETASMALAERVLRANLGCRAQADPGQPTLAAPYVICQVASAAVGRALNVLAGFGKVFEARLTWKIHGFSSWREYELKSVAGCKTCGGHGMDAGGGLVTSLPVSAARDSLAHIEEEARKILGAGDLERPHPWGSLGEDPPPSLWSGVPAASLGIAYGGRLRFTPSGGKPVIVELGGDIHWLKSGGSKIV